MSSDGAIVGYVRRARARAALATALGAILVCAPLGVAAYVAALLWLPRAADAIAVALGVGFAAWMLVDVWRQRVRVADLDARAGLADGLVTYWQTRRSGGDGAMRAWLARTVIDGLRALPLAHAAGSPWRRARRRLAYLLPLLLALLLLRLVWPFGLRSGDRAGVEESSPSAAAGEATGGPEADQATGEVPPPPAGGAPTPDAPDAPAPGAGIDARALALPVREEFVVPTFLAEGPTRTAQGREAELEVTAPARGTGGSGNRPDPAAAPDATFARARELALRARHVPPAERPIVERYFRALAGSDR